MLCCYYPTTIAAIDDDADFLKTIKQHLALPNCILFTSPETAINSLIDQTPFERIRLRLLNSITNFDDTNTTPEYYTLSINLRDLHKEIYTLKRFQDVSVLIVDYHMGEINGIDLCQKLFHHPAKKILLTGGADKEKVAIEAFNKGIIHRFINKSDANFPLQLKQTINVLKEAYFRDLTKIILPNMPPAANILENSAYINFIRNLQNQINAEEYYLLDISGSMIFLDAQGTPTWFIVKNESELDDYEKIALDSDVKNTLINEIKHRKKIPFFFSDEDYQQPAQNWDKYLYKANPLPGIAGCYYALIKGQIHNNIDHGHLISYKRYNDANENENQL